MSLSFPKSEKLKSSKTIKKLFESGKSYTKYPLKLLFIEIDTDQVTQAAFAVPKRKFKLAVTRNRIKRQLREAYRIQREEVTENNGKKFALLFLYLSKDKPQYAQLEKATKALLKKLKDEV
ncbi:ribonuclease P protein component [Ulvibacter litoralis]|uniref:Ribonuclease P protein component n=1 Tax=Ulvibacter litoralis TaxID=227084 RepID=A0A1G7DB51_9FLAO|nr:ribonuclease P protein component [Ulvibacter litoralis]GHC44211.1 ribonuclease P protein component [Ulvibacter litoralis]SDE48739.1 ribonuclease P protein component [Ulvibacter litoralis]